MSRFFNGKVATTVLIIDIVTDIHVFFWMIAIKDASSNALVVSFLVLYVTSYFLLLLIAGLVQRMVTSLQ
jgi:hypothetical protein